MDDDLNTSEKKKADKKACEDATDIRLKIEQFLTDTADARLESERCRDYYDGRQWTEDQIAKLRSRIQAPITVNRVKPKVEGLLGLYDLRKSDPKAFPRTQKHEKSAEVVTDGLRYVADNNQFDSIRLSVGENFFIEGYGGAMVTVSQSGEEIEIDIEEIPWDRIYFDPHSRKKDFSDARYKGVILWMSEDEAEEKFPDADIDALTSVSHGSWMDETFEDRPKWNDSKAKRIRVALHYEIKDGVWMMSVICGDTFLIEPQESPYLDEDGKPTCPIELVSAHIDRDNNRYGEAASFLDQQDEINHRRSKFLHNMSQRQTFGQKGAVKDIPALKRELSKPNGHVEFDGEEFGKSFGVLPTSDMANGQFQLYLDAKGELDAISVNAQLSGERQQGNLSGVAINRLQQAGTMELNRQYSLLAGWEKRIYRQVWARIKQFWTKERWVRVTDDAESIRWVGFNSPVTAQEFLEEKINDESTPIVERRQAAAAYQAMTQANDPRLQQIVDIKNKAPEMDMDIIIDQSFDVINVEQEQFQALTQFAQGSQDIDIIDLIELSQIRNKDELIDKINKRRQAASEAAGNVQEVEASLKKADMMGKAAKADKDQSEANKTKVETQVLALEAQGLIPNIPQQ